MGSARLVVLGSTEAVNVPGSPYKFRCASVTRPIPPYPCYINVPPFTNISSTLVDQMVS